MGISSTVALAFFVLSSTLFLVTWVIMYLSNGTRSTKTIWGLLFLCQTLIQISTLFTVDDNTSSWSNLYRLGFPFSLATPPLVYLYVLSLTQPDFKLSKQSPLHLIPVCVGLLWYFLAGLWQVPLPKIQSAVIPKHIVVGNIALVLTMAIYLYLSYQAVLAFQRSLMNQRSSIAETKLSWLNALMLISFLSVALMFIDVLTGQEFLLWRFRGLVTSLALVVLTFLGLRLSRFFEPDQGNQQQNVPPDELSLLSARLNRYLIEEKLFLQPQLRLSDLAEKMKIKSYRLSEVINRGLKTNFYDLINGLRVDYAKTLLSNPEYKSMSILGIAEESGFNSKSVFNDYFRRHVGIPPSEFRALHLN